MEESDDLWDGCDSLWSFLKCAFHAWRRSKTRRKEILYVPVVSEPMETSLLMEEAAADVIRRAAERQKQTREGLSTLTRWKVK